ncbi:MAG: hypothetical protein AVDCRST_MAG31-342 [uncultured Sphingomonas sp.]|uniref:Uncharacterized protein n=1 Tax=uncultured Sphingomonas sp. TaxID=158754 RepID=A0A6J4SIS4_9SPHN|nr:MAG: hypothetical protein AVDCRST_MAG31-342 [uncultured Sphingomonas sp.]
MSKACPYPSPLESKSALRQAQGGRSWKWPDSLTSSPAYSSRLRSRPPQPQPRKPQ